MPFDLSHEMKRVADGSRNCAEDDKPASIYKKIFST